MQLLPQPRKFQLEFYQPGGQDFLRLVIHDLDTNQAIALHSLSGISKSTDDRRFVLDALFSASGFPHVLRQRLFPNDTVIYDKIEDELGTRYANPRYPKESKSEEASEAPSTHA